MRLAVRETLFSAEPSRQGGELWLPLRSLLCEIVGRLVEALSMPTVWRYGMSAA